MNRIYRVIWNRARCCWVVVAEQIAAFGKQGGQQLLHMPAPIRSPALRADPAICGLTAVWPIRSLVRSLVSFGLLATVMTAMAQAQLAPNALPTGGAVSAGSATISQAGSHMQIDQGSPNAALNWNTFNIGRDASVTFNQPSAQSIALNRVASANPSQIYGALNANGKLILINPNGVVFGQGAQVNAAALIATTKDLSDADFMRGNYRFAGGGTGIVQNNGTIVASPDGSVLLMADKVINTGNVLVRGGTVGLLSGSDLQASPDWRAASISAGPTVQATDVVVDNSGRIDVSDAQGGSITLNGGRSGITQSSGQLVAIGNRGRGGEIRALGYNVGLLSGSQTDASGTLGGGEVLVGGNWQGSGTEPHAAGTYMDPNAVIKANALTQGDGGKVVLWSDGYTNFQGEIQARGGVGGGNGGQVETSSKGFLKAAPKNDFVDATAPAGQAGNWLLDPSDVTITSSGGSGLSGGSYNPTGASGTISNTTINNALNAGTNVTIATTAGSGGVGHLVQNSDAPIAKTAGGDASLNLIANLDLVLDGGISSTAGKLNVSLDASGGAGNGSGAILVSKDIITNGGNLSFLSGTYVSGTSPINFKTAGGKANFKSDLLIANPSGLNIDTVTGSSSGTGGDVTFGGTVDSGDTYRYVGSSVDWNTAESQARGTTAGGAAVGDSYLATPLSALQNLVAARTAGFNPSWLGGSAAGGSWVWVGGIEKGHVFNTTRTGSNPAPGSYTNWNPGEPNAANAGSEYVLQFVGTAGKWNDLAPSNTASVNGYVVQTNLSASPLTVNAGSANVTFNGAVGSLKPLASLTVTGPTAINGGQVTTEQGQTYNSPVTIGNVASTVLESTQSTLQLDSPITYSGSTGSIVDMKAARDVVLNAPITATSGPLSVRMTADTNNTGSGAIALKAPVSTNGGSVTATASSGISGDGAALNTGSAAGDVTLTNNKGGNIALSNGSTVNAGTGNISVTNAAATGGGAIALQDLTGANITVANNATDLAQGQNAVTLNGPVAATGAVSVTTKTGDVQVNQNITSNAQNNTSAIIVAAGTTKAATDNTGGNVKFANSKLVVDSTSRGVVYTGSITGSTGVGSADPGYPGGGHYRYNAAYGDTSRLASNTGTYVQFREQPTLDMNLPGKIYDAQPLDAKDWNNYTVTGWRNGDTGSVNPLAGNLALNGSTSTIAKNAGSYTVALGTLADTLGYKLNVSGPTYTITPAALTITGTPVTKNYGTNDPTLAYTATGLVGGETTSAALSGNLGRNPGENVGVYGETQGSLTANNGNYTITFNPSTLTINKNSSAALNIASNPTGKSFGSDDPTLMYSISGGPFVNTTVQSYDASGNLQNIAINDTQATALRGNLGRQSGETVGNYATTQGSLDAANYVVNFTSANFAIGPASLNVAANAQTKNYGDDDPDLNYTFTNATKAQVSSYDAQGNLTLVSVPGGGGAPKFTGHLGRVSGEDVGQYQIVQGSLTEPNYTITYTPANLNITPSSAPGSILNVVADGKTKVYGQADPALTYQLSNPSAFVNRTVQSYDVNGNLNGTRLADSAANAFTGNVARVSGEDAGTYTITQGSLAAKNYLFNYTSASFEITPAPVVVSGLQAQTKVYDTTTLAQLMGGTLTGVLPSDLGNVSLSTLAANFSDKNVGTNKRVLVSNGILSGSRASNYYIDYIASGTTGTITPAPLRISGVRPQDRVYDGTTNTNFVGTPALSGVYASDVGKVSIPIKNVTGHFSDKNAGTNKMVVSDLSTAVLTGPEAGNYQVVGVDPLANSATVTPALLRISAVPATKLFDGTADSDAQVQAEGLMPGDMLTNLYQKYNTALPGPKNSKRLSANGYELNDGNGGNNYVIVKAVARGTIKPFPNPNGMGGNRLLESENLNLLPLEVAGEDILQKADQGDYFEKASHQEKSTTTSIISLDLKE
ncbi:MBG domain-containing protein [Burkholderia ubonensis]|uniref:MBG domain-containing protein n=1 Tax=Burkholderia ubonensis TaxID=101571 RepID=UPI0009B41204|nr:MBG domain-containing protein [Burkholderia ubonensis]